MSILFMERMDYASDILKTLLDKLIQRSVESRHLELMLRRNESVVEKMLSNWLALNMYTYLKENVGSSLFLLFSALKHQIENGPVDAITHEAKYCLSDEALLRSHINYTRITITVRRDDIEDDNNSHQGADEEGGGHITCVVNDCDTITQVKNKILDVLYKNIAFSQRPCVHDTELVWIIDKNNRQVLSDLDQTTMEINGWKRLNTLQHYKVDSKAVMSLVQKSLFPSSSVSSLQSYSSSASTYVHANHHHRLRRDTGNHYHTVLPNVKYWHIVKPDQQANTLTRRGRGDESGPKDDFSIPEIYLTQLLATKGTVQKFIDDFFSTILSANQSLPPVIKWLFDLFDEAALRHGIYDPEVLFLWKSNGILLRFWVNFIKNPDFLLDIQITPPINSSLAVIAQALMDASLTADLNYGKVSC